MRGVRAFTLLAALFVTACGSSTDSKSEPPPVKETVFGDMVGTMDRAKGVQDTVMQGKQNVDQAVESAETKKQE
jgi:hypothetical protein